MSFNDYPDIPEIIEDGETFFENALKKAQSVSKYTGQTVIADDSGLEVRSLGGKPGVHSARYSGNNATDKENNRKLLTELKDIPMEKRDAAFRCVLVLYRPDGSYDYFEGKLEGMIAFEPEGEEGFGYDPVFIVPRYGCTVAQLSLEVKNSISHRARALKKLKKSLQ